jgi:hypothetical protein
VRADPTVLAASLIRQDVVPMAVGYALTMGALALGLWFLGARRPPGSAGGTPTDRAEPPGDPAGASRRGWPSLVRHVASTAAGGYLLLIAVVFLYYRLVARQGPGFLRSAVTGNAMLAFAVALPAFLAISWTVERRRRASRGLRRHQEDPPDRCP